MNAEAFVFKLSELAPIAARLSDSECESSFVNEFLASYRCIPTGDKPLPNDQDEVIRLISGWDCSDVEVGAVRLQRDPSERSGNIQVGEVEVDRLMLCSNSGMLLVEELDAPGHCLWEVSRNGASFLDALAAAAEFLTRRTVGEIDWDDLDLARKCASHCTDLAGGVRFVDFWLMLFGIGPSEGC